MFEVKIKKHGKLRISFRHHNPAHQYIIADFGTHCDIISEKKGKLISGSTHLHENDWEKYDKEFGRKLSLTRAISGIPRSERTKIWKAYFEAKGKKK